ncbi:HxlR family transcriptional regulator [Kaistia sp. 32K]|uniref:winged helix-turn-helix transcriptional regulator n=1 Tax=Kaistia sp. 32K TaxID=2795690 RepID=UPI001915128F|nr:helix-turn-helix domain-containing protein [Kaistia sp. 32K]BCP51516.1 HxlR family transcriptional regulator [Kaistia sp. 32K]
MAKNQDLESMRLLLDLLSDKWTVLILTAICTDGGRQRFNAIRRAVPAISQKSLATCLKRLEMNGLVERHVMTTGELAVEYRVTPLGYTLEQPVGALLAWSADYQPAVRAAQEAYRLRLAEVA